MCRFLSKRAASKTVWAQAVAAMGRSTTRLQQEFETFTTGQMGILVRPGQDQDGPMAQAELERALGTNEALRSYGYHVQLDSGGFPWVVIRAEGLVALTTAADAAGDALARTGLTSRTIAGVFPFTWKDQRLYWVYQPRVQGFSPFVPLGKTEEEERDHPLEVRMARAMEKSIPVVKDTAEWYPVWDMPF